MGLGVGAGPGGMGLGAGLGGGRDPAMHCYSPRQAMPPRPPHYLQAGPGGAPMGLAGGPQQGGMFAPVLPPAGAGGFPSAGFMLSQPAPVKPPEPTPGEAKIFIRITTNDLSN